MEPKTPPTVLQLRDALMYIQDRLDRASIPFLLLKDTAYDVKNFDELRGGEVTIGVRKYNLTDMTYPTLKMLIPEASFEDTCIRLEHHNAPIFIKLIKNNYKFFQNPDTVFFFIEQFHIPNPFNNYWSSRHIIR